MTLVSKDREKIYLNQLRNHAIRSPELVVPGTRVIFAHIPDHLDGDSFEGTKQIEGETVTVLAVEEMSFEELHPHAPGGFKGSDEKKLVVLFTDDRGRQGYRYASDCGLEPYNGVLNPTNIVVSVDCLKAKGWEPVLEPSKGYRKDLERYNKRFNRWDGQVAGYDRNR